MANVDTAVVARYKQDGKTFEVLVDCAVAMQLKQGQSVSLQDVFVADEVFTDNKKGERATDDDLQAVFGTTNFSEVGKQIIMKGEVQLTAAYRKQLQDAKMKRLVELIRVHGVNPTNGHPHPADRISSALEESKFSLSEYKSAQEQVEEAVKAIQAIIPIKIAVQELAVRIPAEYAGKAYGAAKQLVKIKKEAWQNDGSLYLIVELPAGLQEAYTGKLNEATKGTVQITIEKTE